MNRNEVKDFIPTNYSVISYIQYVCWTDSIGQEHSKKFVKDSYNELREFVQDYLNSVSYDEKPINITYGRIFKKINNVVYMGVK